MNVDSTYRGSNEFREPLKTEILVPAYNAKKEGVLFAILIKARPSDCFKTHGFGGVAIALEKIVDRSVAIMSNLNDCWMILRQFEFTLKSEQTGYRIVDSRSASLSICIALFNFLREINGLEQVHHLTGTGILRADGAFEQTYLEDEKENISLHHRNRFINSQICKHVFDLEHLMNNQ